MKYFAKDFDPQEYDCITDLSGNENVTLMCHHKTKKMIIRKTVSGINKKLYNQLINLRHENLVQVIGLETTPYNYYTYEEYINGETLAELLTHGPIAEEQAIGWVKQLCQAIKLFHEQSPIIIHRDIKPANVMLSPDGVIKLIDFDASKEFTVGQQRDTELVGTPNYAAPEQYGFAASDPRTDIYAIGILLHELITGYKPNEIKSPYQGRYKTIIQKCIQLDQKRRYQSVQELEDQFERRGLENFIKKLLIVRTETWHKKTVVVLLCLFVMLAFVSTFLSKYKISNKVVPQIEEIKELPTSTDEITIETVPEPVSVVEDKSNVAPNDSTKLTTVENKLPTAIPSLPPETTPAPVYKMPPFINQKQKLPPISLDTIAITASLLDSDSLLDAEIVMTKPNAFEVVLNNWKSWRKKNDDAIYFPLGSALEITVENKNGFAITKPTLHVNFYMADIDEHAVLNIAGLKNNKTRFTYNKKIIDAKSRFVYRIPLENIFMKISPPTYPVVDVITIIFIADRLYNKPPIHLRVKLEKNYIKIKKY